MSNASASAIRLPSLRGHWRGADFARRVLLGQFQKLATGSLELHEGGASHHFGNIEQDSAEPVAVIHVQDATVYQLVLSGGVVGAGEAYMLGYWTTPDLVAVIRLFSANMRLMQAMDAKGSPLRRLALKLLHTMNRNTVEGARRNISAHYDLGNDFFRLFLDPSMMYSSAVFPDAQTSLEDASAYKLDLLCRQLELSPQDHLLEIGTGWGGMALHAARHYGCRVTTTTISREQYDYARRRVREAGLQDQITVLCQDYRKLEGKYDKLVSVEMIEAVGK